MPNLTTPSYERTWDRLKLLVYLQQNLTLAHQRKHFVDEGAHAAALAKLQAERRALEMRARLRPAEPEKEAVPVARAAAGTDAAAVDERAAPGRPPREPVTWDRIWQTLLSERTLNVLLFR